MRRTTSPSLSRSLSPSHVFLVNGNNDKKSNGLSMLERVYTYINTHVRVCTHVYVCRCGPIDHWT